MASYPTNASSGRSRDQRIVAGAVLAGLFAAVLWAFNLLERPEYIARDTLVASMMTLVDSDLVVIEIDSNSIESVGQWPWPRSLYARALERIQREGAASVMIDIDLSSRSDPASDRELADALAAVRGTLDVRLPVFVQPESLGDPDLVLRKPLPMFADYAELVAVNLYPERDGMVRFVDPELNTGPNRFPSAWSAISGVSGQPTWLDYRIAPESFTDIRFTQLLDSTTDLSVLSGKHVLIGATAIELGDILPVPIHRALPGVIVQALGAQTLLQGGLFRLGVIAEGVLVAVFWLTAFALFRRAAWLRGLIISSLVTLGWILVARSAYQYANLMVPVVGVLATWWLTYLASMIGRLDAEVFERLLAQMRLRDERALLNRIVTSANDCILSVDDRGVIVLTNPAAEKLTGMNQSQLLGQQLAARLPDLNQDRGNDQSAPFDTFLLNAQGARIPVEVSISPVEMTRDRVDTVIIRDLTERVQREDELRYQATHDKLTGLLNRDAFFKRINDGFEQWRGGTLISLDLDYFREVNDAFGHAVGDLLLVRVAQDLSMLLRSSDLMARVGGDTFAFWLPGLNVDSGGEAFAERLLAAFNMPFTMTVDGEPVRLQISATVGIADLNQDGLAPSYKTGADKPLEGLNEAEGLLRRAANAMLQAKSDGVALRVSGEDDKREAVRRLELVPAIRAAIPRNEFRLAYQPKLALDTLEVIGAEVLLRWPQAQRLGIGVGTFIEVAENSRQIAPLTRWVVEHLLSREDFWRTHGLPRHMAINLSARLLQDSDFIAGLEELMGSSNGYFQFELEITETALMANRARALALMERLIARGASLAIDDYGTGYSSLAYLRDLKADTLKIDQSFVTHIADVPDNQVIVQSTVRMAHDLGMKVVAEGVETQSDQQFLQHIGCDIGQGYHFAKPMLADDLMEWMAERSIGQA